MTWLVSGQGLAGEGPMRRRRHAHVTAGYCFGFMVSVMCCASAAACGALPVDSVRFVKLRDSLARVRDAGAMACAPRELALARAHYGFAQIELRNGDVPRALQHLDEAEMNLGAAQVLTPERGCKGAGQELPAEPRPSADVDMSLETSPDGTSISVLCRGAAPANAEADGCSRRRIENVSTYAVKNFGAPSSPRVKHGRRDILPAIAVDMYGYSCLSLSSSRRAEVKLAGQVSSACLSKPNTTARRLRDLDWTRLTARVDGETRRNEAIAASSVHAINRRFELKRIDAAPNGYILMLGCRGHGPLRS